MTTKKIFGYIFIFIAAILTIIIIGQLNSLISLIFGIIQAISGQLDSGQAGVVTGMFFYWIIHFGITILLWKKGLLWAKKQAKN